MSDYTAIADVSDTLISLLKENMAGLITPASIALSSPAETGTQDPPRLALFLYQIVENAYQRNQEMHPLSPDTAAYPPLTLDLYHLLISYGSSQIADRTDRVIEEQKVLGRAMQVFYDHPILTGSILNGYDSFTGFLRK